MKRGDVVEVDWLYSDQTGSKLRPAVVVQGDFLNGIIDDTILVKITSRRFGIPGTEVALDPAQETGAGLNRLCWASCRDVMTRDETLVLRTAGVLSAAAMHQIEACLKTVLQLP